MARQKRASKFECRKARGFRGVVFGVDLWGVLVVVSGMLFAGRIVVGIRRTISA